MPCGWKPHLPGGVGIHHNKKALTGGETSVGAFFMCELAVVFVKLTP